MYQNLGKTKKSTDSVNQGKSITDVVQTNPSSSTAKIEEVIQFYHYIRQKYSKRITTNNPDFFAMENLTGIRDSKVESDNTRLQKTSDIKNNIESDISEKEYNLELASAQKKGIYFDKEIFNMLRNGIRVNSDFLKYVADKHGRIAIIPDKYGFDLYVSVDEIDKYFKNQRPSLYEAALMANHVYGAMDAPALQGNWRVSNATIPGVQYNNEVGFQSNLYEKVDGDRKVIAYAYVTRGTDELQDWNTGNIQQTMGMIGPQYSQSMFNAMRISEIVGDMELTMVGHSLGGGLAHANSAVTGRECIVFNPAGLSVMTTLSDDNFKRHALSDQDNDATNIIVEGEMLNFVNTFQGGAFLAGKNSGDEKVLENGDPNTLPLWLVNPALGLLADLTKAKERHGMDVVLDLMRKNAWKK